MGGFQLVIVHDLVATVFLHQIARSLVKVPHTKS